MMSKIYHFRAKDWKIKPYYFKKCYSWYHKEAGLNGYSYDFRVDYNTIDVSDIVDIHKNLRKKCSIK